MSLIHTWLPAAAPDVKEPLKIIGATGSHLIREDGQYLYDAIASWWCKALGHRHPLVQNSLKDQLLDFEHHIPANTYNDSIEELSTRLVAIFSEMDKVMYASDGSSAMEIALKLSYETRVLLKQPERKHFISLKGNYHGETLFTLSVCGIDAYKAAYEHLLPKNYFIDDIVYVDSRTDPKWHDCQFDHAKFDAFFKQLAPCVTALVLEPIVQGAGNLKIISRDFLIQLIACAKKYALHIICDEIMVGLGRLGCHSVSKEILHIEPDIVCFSKNLTAGSIPMSAVVIHRSITEIFRFYQQAFPHSHTHSCNALGAKVAVNYLHYLATSSLLADVNACESLILNLMQRLQEAFPFFTKPRAIGAIGAGDLLLEQDGIKKIFAIGIKEGIYLRPIGATLYILPPLYNIRADLIEIEAKLFSVLTVVAKA